MSATVMNPSYNNMHRKPLPAQQRSFNNLQQQPQHPQQSQYAGNYSQPRGPPNGAGGSPVYGVQAPQHQQAYYNQTSRRTPSNATSSTSSTGLQRAPTSSSMPRRSTSSRSTGSASPTSYVALMRKQKATVWCDRAQQQDPVFVAQQRHRKMEAARAVAGGKHHDGRVSTSSNNQGSGGIRSKIRHQGAPKASTYTDGANISGMGVPLRLSATEVDEDDSEDEDSKYAKYNQQNGSGRSSLGSGPRGASGHLMTSRGHSNGSTPPTGHSPVGSMGYVAEEETPVPTQSNLSQSDYFERSSEETVEAEQRFGGIGGLPASQPKTEQDLKTLEELRRRGSVDDRAMTMSGQRLFVANPDLSD